ncbi:excinuclease ABC subunit C [Candidatus Saccharibacteria bacterium RIFCSPHIGHO2_12_FULL_47_16b]|nr:MAG: excinuclease ABC subunit C [Candidatus Saccharibacteria bacterium RIFCSPHIGHO2_12_FULL_47_16b]
MMSKLEKKLSKLPKTPGVYFFKDKTGEIIYIGKAANLGNRVRQYFQASRYRDAKTDQLVAEITDLDWSAVETEVDALFLEAELVRRYLPRYNIMLRDDKSLLYVRIDIKSDYPTVKLVRRPLDDGAEYFGPYLSGFSLKKALRYLRRAFPYAISRPQAQKRASLYYHLGLDPGLEESKTTLVDYRQNLRKLTQYLRGHRQTLMREIEKEMKRAAKAKQFEQAAKLRNQLQHLQALSQQIIFSDREIQDAAKDQALVELANLVSLKQPPRRIEGFDISHIGGTDTTASLVVFVDGLPYKTAYRKFKIKGLGNDDFAHLYEAIKRRFKVDNIKKWGLPDLILIDGGKGQLAAGLKALDEVGQAIPTIGLAKRFEEIIINQQETKNNKPEFEIINLPQNSHLVKLLQRIRDESHRFAVSYHELLRTRRQTVSILDQIPGIGPITRKKLIRHFGSAKAVMSASTKELSKVISRKMAIKITQHFKRPSYNRE